jgi:NADH:ubiquinone oxidoreductase subunit E
MQTKVQLKICLGSSCFARGNKAILQIVKSFISNHELADKIDFRGNHCFGECLKGPNMSIDGQLFHAITLENVESILRENILNK